MVGCDVGWWVIVAVAVMDRHKRVVMRMRVTCFLLFLCVFKNCMFFLPPKNN